MADERCTAALHIADDYGDNHATMRCQRERHPDGPHRMEWRNGQARVEWYGDDSEAGREGPGVSRG